jgi:hypothetical protein
LKRRDDVPYPMVYSVFGLNSYLRDRTQSVSVVKANHDHRQ